MRRDFNTGQRKSLEADRVKHTRRRKQLLRDMGLSEDLDSTELAEKLHEQSLVFDVLNRSLVSKDVEIEKLKVCIAELENGVKPIIKTSANSSISPSKNPIGIPHTQSLRKPSCRKTGGQKGHQRSTRLQSESGVENYATIGSVIQTAIKNKQNPFEALRVIATIALA